MTNSEKLYAAAKALEDAQANLVQVANTYYDGDTDGDILGRILTSLDQDFGLDNSCQEIRQIADRLAEDEAEEEGMGYAQERAAEWACQARKVL